MPVRFAHLNPLDGIRRLRRVLAALERLPELQTRVEQLTLAYQKDARYTDRVVSLRARFDAAAIGAHTRAAIQQASFGEDPSPHLTIDSVVPDALYDEMLSSLPSPTFFKQEATREEMQVPFVLAPAYSRAVWDLFFQEALERAMVPALTERFRPALDAHLTRYWPSLGSWEKAGLTLTISNSRLLLRRPGYVIKPHRDPRWHFLTCLLYLQKPRDVHGYGTQLYRLRHEREATHTGPLRFEWDDCEFVKDVPAMRNRALVFFNSVGAHAASIPSDAPADLERYVYQVQLGPDTATRERLIALLSASDRRGWAGK